MIDRLAAERVTMEFLASYPGAFALAYKFRDTVYELYGDHPDIPETAKGAYLSRHEFFQGRAYQGRVDVVLGNVKSADDMLETLRHEVIGHYGMNTFTPEDRRALLNALIAAREEPGVREAWADINKRYADVTLDEQAEEVWALYCEKLPLLYHADNDHAHAQGEQSFREVCIDRSRPMRLDDLHNIACMVAQGIRDRSRVQQTFPQLPEHRLSIAHNDEPRTLDFGNRSLDELAQEYAAMDGTDGGHLIDVDRIRELSPEYRADRSRANDIHAAASKFSQQLYEHALAQPVGEGGRRPVVVFTAGGSGSGKSTAIGKLLGAGNADITLDGTFSKLDKARNRVQAALDSGRDVEIRYVFRAPEKAAETAIGRAIRHGRPVPVSVMAENHVQALQTVRTIAKNFKGDKRVMIIAIDNNGDKADDAYITDITKIPEVHYDDAKHKFEAAIDATWRQQQRAVHENAAASFGRGTQSPGAQTPPDRHVDAGRGSVDGGTTRLERATIPGSPESGGEGRDRDAVTPTLTPELYKAFMGHEPPAQGQVSAVQDAAYMDAVERGDMETARQMVRDAFRAAFPKTKIVDESGDPLVVFHSYEGDAPHYGNEQVWLSANREFSAEFGENTDEVFVNLENPYIVEDYFRDADGNVIILEDGYPAEIGFLAAAPYEYRAWLRENYDGVMDDCKEFIVAFDALQQVKYADPVTYDDDGNVIPLSQRIGIRDGSREQQTRDDAPRYKQRGWHASPYRFERFSLDNIGSGEGSQVHGWGLYIALNQDTAQYGYLPQFENRLYAYLFDGKRYTMEAGGMNPWRDEDGNELPDGAPLSYALHALTAGGNRYADVDAAVQWLERYLKEQERQTQFAARDEIGMTEEEIQTRKRFDKAVGAGGEGLREAAEAVGEAEDRSLARPEVQARRQELLQDERFQAMRDAIELLRSADVEKVVAGQLYEVEIPGDEVMLREEADLAEQPQPVKDALLKLLADDDEFREGYFDDEMLAQLRGEADGNVGVTGEELYQYLYESSPDAERASLWLHKYGIQGIRYDGMQDGECAVIFDDDAIEILQARYRHLADEERAEEQGAQDEQTAPARLPTTDDLAATRHLNEVMQRQHGWTGAYSPAALPDELANLRDAIQAAFGRTVRVVQPNAEKYNCFGGVYLPSRPGEVFVNVQNGIGFMQIAGHELLHDMRRTRPDLYYWFKRRAEEYLTGLPEYRERLEALEDYRAQVDAATRGMWEEHKEHYALEYAKEELLADFTGDALADPKFLGQLAKDDGHRFTGLVKHVTGWLKGIGRKMFGTRSERYVSDVDRLREHLQTALVAYVNGETVEEMLKLEDRTERTERQARALVDSEYGDPDDEEEVDEAVTRIMAARREFQETEVACGGHAAWKEAHQEGKTKLEYRQWVQVRTPRFKEWFGDWENIPVGEGNGRCSIARHPRTGEPLVVYHGSRRSGFTVFDNQGRTKSIREGMHFFSSKENVAQSYSGTYSEAPLYMEDGEEYNPQYNYDNGIYPVFLNIRKPHEAWYDGANWDGVAYGMAEIYDNEADENVENPHTGGFLFDSEREAEEYAEKLGLEDYEIGTNPLVTDSTNEEAERGRTYGHDGTVLHDVVDDGGVGHLTDETSTVFVVYSSEQIKSATGNVGFFNSHSKDIRFARDLKTPGEIQLEADAQAFAQQEWLGAAGTSLPLGHTTTNDKHRLGYVRDFFPFGHTNAYGRRIYRWQDLRKLREENLVRYMFTGERGAQSLDAAEEVTHRMDNLAVAREMEQAGKDAKAVKLATGWERGKDGKWRYEFEDDYYHPRKIVDALTAEWKKKQSVLYKQEREVYDKFIRLEGQIPARLGKKFSEEEKTKFREMRKELKAYWQQYMELSRARSDVELHPEFSTTLEKTLFADNPLLKAHPELADIKVQAGALPFGVRGAYNYETRTITLDSALPLEQFPSVLAHEVQHTIQHVEGFARGGNSKQFDGKELDAERVRSEADAARKQGDIAQAEKLELLADEIDENALNGQIEIDGHMYENAFEAYRALAGETEARNVQTRMGMTLEERRNSLAEDTEDVARADQIVLHELMDKAETTGAAFSFTGERGAQSLDAAEEVTHRMDNLAVAREMEQAGKDAKAVKLATGWERGKDGKWRYELDDSQVEVDLFVASLGSARNPEYLRLRRLNEKYANYTLGNSEDVFTAEDEAEFQRLKNSEVGRAYAAATENGYKKLRAGEAVPLSDVMYAPELFNAYPQLEYVKVRVGEPYNAGADAEVNIGKEGIVITVKQLLAYSDKARSPLLHEVQHVIQHMEGFAQGASPINMPPELVEHFNRERTERYVEAGERLDEVAAENGISRFDALAEGFQATDLRLANAITDFRNAQEAMLAGSHFEAYRRTAGETEARNVQTRMGMTLEERRNSLAEETEDVARADQIVLRELMDRAESRAAAALNAPKFKRTVWHASPYGGIEKEGFKMHAIGTGEGAQVFGWGIYMAGARATAVDNYRQALANRHIVNPDLHQGKDGKQGQVYRLQIPVAHKDLLDYDAPLAEQPKKVREALDGILQSTGDLFGEDAGFWENARAHLILNECSTLVDKSNLLKAVDRNGEYVAPVYILKFTGEADADIEMAKRWAARTLVDARLYDEDVRHKYVASMRERLLAAARNHGVDGELPLANAFDRALEELSLKELQGWNFSLFGRQVSVAPTKEPFGHSPPEVIVDPSCTTLENAVDVALRAYKQDILPTLTGGEFYEGLAAVCHDARGASEKLLKTGIPGLRYLDAVSREQDEGGTYNYVIWDESLLTPEAANIRALFSRSNMRESMNDNTESNRIYGNHENTNPVRMLYAAGDGDIDAVRAYISAGGDVNAIDKAPVYTSAIIQAAEYGHAEIVRLLIEHGADVNATKTGATALMLAAAKGRAEIVNMLLEAGADIAHKDYTNKQALHYAAQFGRTDIARALIDTGADIEAVDRKGSTALMFAAGNGYIETARLLIERGANINARTEYGRTPLMVAALDDAAPASAEDQAAAEVLNQSLARQFSNPAWQNAYQATALPSELAGLRAEFQAAFGRTIRPVLPTSPEFDCYGGVYLPEHPGEVFVNLRQPVDFLQLAGHEMLHDIKRTRPDLYNWFIEQADSYLVNVEDYRERLNRFATATGEKPHTLQSAKEELIADFCGDALADVKFCGQLAASDSNRFTGLLHHVTAWLGKLGDKLRGMDSSRHVKDVDGLRKHLSDALVAYAKGEKLEDMPSYRQAKAEAFDTPVASVETRETDKGVALFSQKPPKLSEEERAERGREYGRRILAGAAQWEKVVDKAWNIKDAKEQQGSPLKMGHTPDILVEVGLPDLDLYMTTGVMHKITDDKHHLTKEQVKALYAELADPVAVIRDEQGRHAAVTTLREGDDPVIVGLLTDYPQGDKKGGGRLLVNRVTSAYGKQSFFGYMLKHAREGNVLYLDKKRLADLVDAPSAGDPTDATSLRLRGRIFQRFQQALRGRVKQPSHVVKPIFDAAEAREIDEDRAREVLPEMRNARTSSNRAKRAGVQFPGQNPMKSGHNVILTERGDAPLDQQPIPQTEDLAERQRIEAQQLKDFEAQQREEQAQSAGDEDGVKFSIRAGSAAGSIDLLAVKEKFAEDAREIGLIIDDPIADGQFHRVPVEGCRHGKLPGSYFLRMDGHCPGGFFNNFMIGVSKKWSARSMMQDAPPLTRQERQEMSQAIAEKKEQDARERTQQHEAVAQHVARWLASCPAVTMPSPYMIAKGIKPLDNTLRRSRDGQKIYVSMHDEHGKIWSQQTIYPDGRKTFSKGGRKYGCFHAIGGLGALDKAQTVVIAEGFATAASLSEALKQPTVVAFDAGNLKAVAEALRRRYPDKPIVIAGDDDYLQQMKNGNNPGREKAQVAAEAVDGLAVFPEFAPGERERGLTDFNDLLTKSRVLSTDAWYQVQQAVYQAQQRAARHEEDEYRQTQAQRQTTPCMEYS